MPKMRIISILAALALAVALPACGDDEPATDATTQEQTSTEDATGTTVPEPSSEDVQAAIDACKQSVDSAPQLSDDAKTEIAGICEEGDTSDPEQIKNNAGKVCERVVEETVTQEQVREQALETCRTATE